MSGRRVALDSIIVLGFFFFLLGSAIFYDVLLGPGRGGTFFDYSWSVAITLLMMLGGLALFFAGVHYRKSPKMNLWESVLLGYVILLLLDLFVFPDDLLFQLPLNGGGILIFAFFIMSLVGIIVSAFKYVETNKNETLREVSGPIQRTSSKRRHVYALIFASGLLLATSLWLSPSILYGGGFNYGCPIDIGELSFQISNYSQLVGPPLFSQEQFVIAPGSTTYVTYIWNTTGNGNNVTEWFTRPPDPNRFNYTSLWRINTVTGEFDGVPTSQEGVSDVFQNITFQGIHVAKILYKITTSESASPATYELTLSCDYHLLMTLGSMPHWGPLPYGQLQPIELIFNLAFAMIGSSLVVAVLHFHGSHALKHDKIR